jgi:membrane-bound ClpP family serine protease
MTTLTTMTQFVASLSPNAALLLLSAGLALIAFELNRPGSILPGACGLLLTLLAAAALLRCHPRPWAMALSVIALGCLLVQLRRTLPLWAAALATAALVGSLAGLVPADRGARLHPAVTTLCGLILGAGITLLTRVARRARLNKGLD